MTQTSIPLTAINASPDPTRRDQWGRYLIVPPTGGPPVGYTRVTTVAKTLDNGGGLADWKAAMTASGIIMRRGLRAEWEALLAVHGDPWYDGDASKAECKRLVSECAAVGGANDRRQMGSSLHTITALVDLGKAPQHLTSETERDVDAYVNGLAAAHISVVPGAVELVTALDSYQVAGTFDRLAIVPGFDLPLIADLKTGANLEYSFQSIAVQLAGYSRGERLYQQGAAKDGSQDHSQPMPAVDQDWGLVLWLKAGEGVFELYLVDLTEGWHAFQQSMWARSWARSNPQRLYAPASNNQGMTIPVSSDDLTAQLEASLATHPSHPQPVDNGHPQPVDVTDVYQQPVPLDADTVKTPGFSPAAQDLETVHDVRNWLQQRIDDIGQHAQARQALGKLWPDNIPTLRASTNHTAEQLGAIERLLDDVERRYELPFGEPSPGAAKVLDLFPGSTIQPTNKEPA